MFLALYTYNRAEEKIIKMTIVALIKDNFSERYLSMKTLPSIMVVGDIEKSRRLETSIVKALEEVGYTLTDFHRVWDPKKPVIKIRYYDKYEPTWNYTHHTVEIPLTEEEYENYAHAGIDKIVRTLKEHAENTKKELYNRAYSTIKDK